MNTPTIMVALLTLWLVMGLGFLSAYSNHRRQGKSLFESLLSFEGVLFILSVIIPLVVLIHKTALG
jgi:hypothetical protein